MSHANAALTPRQRLRLAQKIVDEEWTIAAAADYFRVSGPTAKKWALRYLELGAEAWPTGRRVRTLIPTGPRNIW